MAADTHHHSCSLTPANILPSEVLSHIFHLVQTQSCIINRLSGYKRHNPTYPECFAHVCTFWRKTAISTGLLWCHIDIPTHKPNSDALVARAERYAVRAGFVPIELHIAENKEYFSGSRDDRFVRLLSLLSRISGRVKSLEFAGTGNFFRFHRSVFESLFCSRYSILQRLVICPQGNHSNVSIFAGTGRIQRPGSELTELALDLPEDRLEKAFASVSVLHLRGVFPSWSSKAYHDLVDLRLVSPLRRWSSIVDTEIVTILEASPGLQVLHFGLMVLHQATRELAPSHMEYLENVNIFLSGKQTPNCPSSILRFLVTGMRPLRLSIEGSDVPETTMEKFFKRSRVTSFYIREFIPSSNFLAHATHLKQLVIDNFRAKPGDRSSTWLGLNLSGPALLSQRLEMLHITRSTLLNHQLGLLLKYCPGGTTMHSSVVTSSYGGEVLSNETILAAFPTVKIAGHTVNSGEDSSVDWDLLDS